MAMIIPTFTLFVVNPTNVFISMRLSHQFLMASPCLRELSYRVEGVLVVIPKRDNMVIVAFSASVLINNNTYVQCTYT